MTTLERSDLTAPALGPATRRLWVPALLALAAALVRLPFIGRPLSPDEGGFLLVASQWHPGASLYGAYFVDRPPLLVALFGLADAVGGEVPLRLLGILAVVVAVLAAGRLGGSAAAAVAAVFLSTPLADAMEIDGELLAVPFVLVSALLLVTSLRARSDPARYAAALAAGVSAAAAALVKQNMVDGLLVGAVLLTGLAVRRRWWDALSRAVAFGAGALGAVVVALLLARLRGTDPSALWDALVTFRAQADSVIGSSANDATPHRAHGLVVAFLLGGAPLVVVGALLGRRRPVHDRSLLVAALVVLAWEATGVVLGGSYWWHYLLALVPGLVLLVAACDAGRWVGAATGYAAVSCAVALAFALTHPVPPGPDGAVAAYLRQHADPGDTAVVAFGHPDIVYDAGLQSPYEHLWSLSARVRDPRLGQLTGILAGPRAPRWVVVAGDSLATWGIDPAAAQAVLDTTYQEVTQDGDWHVFERVRSER